MVVNFILVLLKTSAYTRLKRILILVLSPLGDQMNAKCILGELLTTYLQPFLGVEEVMKTEEL